MLYDNVYVKPAQGYRLLLILFAVFLALALLQLIFFLFAVCSLRRQAAKEGDGKPTTSNGNGTFDAKYSKVSTAPTAAEVG